MNSNLITQVVLLGIIAIIGIIGLQAYWIYQSYNLKGKEFNDRVNIALIDVAEKIAEYNDAVLPQSDLIIRESPNYFVVNIDDVIDPEVLEHYLTSTFTRHALNIDFEYAVFDCHTKEMVYGNYCSMTDAQDEPAPKPLPKYEEFTYYFGVRFPTMNTFILKDMSRIWVVSIILGITLLFFGYAMYVILYQKRYSELQKDFINNMTHEFKTPITSIKLSSDALSLFEPIQKNERFSKYVQIIKNQNERINKHVEQVLNLAKLEKDHFKLKKEVLNLNDILTSIMDAYDLQLEEKGSLTYINKMDHVYVKADRSHLVNVIHNLMDNAVKYSNDSPVITLSLEAHDHRMAEITVKDEGIGIKKEYLHKITKKFFRVPTGNVHDVKGFGLGLYYVKQIIRAHHWKFELDSTFGKGTVAKIILPIVKKSDI